MTNISPSLTQLTDDQLLAEVKRLASHERHATARLIASLAEMDTRRLYLGEGCSSLFTYCTQVLHLSEHAAYGRIEAARASRQFPIILDLLADGSVTLTAVCLLKPHLTAENHRELLEAARHKSKREVEHLIARVHPQPPVPSSVRRLPSPKTYAAAPAPPAEIAQPPGGSNVPPPPVPKMVTCPAEVHPLSQAHYKVQLTVSAETYEKLRRAQDLLRHSVPTGDPAAIFDRALTALVAQLEKTKLAATEHPRAERLSTCKSRHIPAVVKRAVWTREGAQCAFVGTNGRCTERGFLEFHHVLPYSAGGEATIDNVELRCRAHNAYEADLFFCRERMLAREVRPVFRCANSVRTEFAADRYSKESGDERDDHDGHDAEEH